MDVNAEDSAGATPLADAVRCGRREEQAALRGAGGRLGAADSAERLCLAAAANDLDTLNVRPRPLLHQQQAEAAFLDRHSNAMSMCACAPA
jgi:hypothetical protein